MTREIIDIIDVIQDGLEIHKKEQRDNFEKLYTYLSKIEVGLSVATTKVARLEEILFEVRQRSYDLTIVETKVKLLEKLAFPILTGLILLVAYNFYNV